MDRWFLELGSRLAAKQHLSRRLRSALLAALEVAAHSGADWAYYPCISLGLFEEAWNLQRAPYAYASEVPPRITGLPRALQSEQYWAYLWWVAGWPVGAHFPPSPSEARIQETDSTIELLGIQSASDPAIVDRLVTTLRGLRATAAERYYLIR